MRSYFSLNSAPSPRPEFSSPRYLKKNTNVALNSKNKKTTDVTNAESSVRL